jgi:uncharacterized membrane protein HdeD (DUF308 family)
MVLSSEDRAVATTVAGYWWLYLVTGVLWFCVSLVVLRFQHESITTVGVILGVFFLLAGLNEFGTAAVDRSWRWLHALMGVLFLVGSLWAFIQPEEAFWALASVLGLLLILKGSIDIIEAVVTKDYNPLWGLGLAAGIIELLLGFWASQQYYAARATLIIIWVGFAALFRGIGEIVLAFRLRSDHKDLAAA